MPITASSSLPKYLARALRKIGTRATVITGHEHSKNCQRLADRGLTQILSTGRDSTIAVLTEAGSAWLARPV